MRLDQFDFELPPELIALRPARPRDSARLLVAGPEGPIVHRAVSDAPNYFRRGDVLVFNDTRVLRARLHGVRVREESSVAVEATLLRRVSPSRWRALAKPGKRLRVGDRILFGAACSPRSPPPDGKATAFASTNEDPRGVMRPSPLAGEGREGGVSANPRTLASTPPPPTPPRKGEGVRTAPCSVAPVARRVYTRGHAAPDRGESLAAELEAVVSAKGEEGDITLDFALAGAALDKAIEACGDMPLPPYIASQRAPDEDDAVDYQTVYAARDGAVAAPTAGLHFTKEMLARLDACGVERVHVTLHVGAGTFLPVKTEDVAAHVMHAEWREVSKEAAQRINRARNEGRRVIAIGTTALRTLESSVGGDGRILAGAGDTSIFLKPGARFHVVDGLWTNFHLPRSTLFMLVAAFVGLARAHAIYAAAIAARYRFYSYGDASLLWRTS